MNEIISYRHTHTNLLETKCSLENTVFGHKCLELKATKYYELLMLIALAVTQWHYQLKFLLQSQIPTVLLLRWLSIRMYLLKRNLHWHRLTTMLTWSSGCAQEAYVTHTT